MENIFLTSCGIIDDSLKEKFYKRIPRDKVCELKVLYITTASDGETDDDKTWMDDEFKTILDLGFLRDNIVEYKIGKTDADIKKFDVIYMMGGNTFYLLDVIRKTNFGQDIKNFISSGGIYIGSSAGSEILGNSIYVALGYDENNVNMTDFTGLKIVDGLIVPHCNRKKDFITKLKKETDDKLYLLYDGDGIVI